MGYPTSVFSPTTKNNGDVVQASHINDLQTEVTAIETAVINGSWTVPNQPRCHLVGSSVTQSVSSSQSTGVRVQYSIGGFDVGGGWSIATNEYTTPSSGAYLVNTSLYFTGGSASGYMGAFLNGSLYDFVSLTTADVTHQATFLIHANASATLHIAVVPASTSALTLGAEHSRRMTIVKLC